MTQSPGTGIRTFVASLWGQAALCQYVVPCTEPGCIHEFDFSEEIINDNLVRGIAEPEIMSDLLGDPKTDRTLEETVYFIVTRSAVGDCAGATCNTTKPKLLTALVPSAGHVEVPPMVPRMIVGPDPGAVRHGHSHGAKCTVKCHYTPSCSKCTTCGAWGHRDKSSRICFQAGTRKNSPKDRGPATKAQDDNNAGCVFTSYALHQDIIDHLIVPVPRAPLLWPPSTGTAPGRLHVWNTTYLMDKWVARPFCF